MFCFSLLLLFFLRVCVVVVVFCLNIMLFATILAKCATILALVVSIESRSFITSVFCSFSAGCKSKQNNPSTYFSLNRHMLCVFQVHVAPREISYTCKHIVSCS